jgi:hypothetical protein
LKVSQTAESQAQEKFEDWLRHPVTIQLNRWLRQQVQQTQTQWASGNFTAESAHATVQLNAQAIGRVQTLQELLDLEFSFLMEQQSNE